jgi:hypothetical protein
VSADVTRLRPVEVGEGFRFDPDEILEAAKGRGFTTLIIVGDPPEGGPLYFAGSANAGESLILLERAKLQVIRPEE